jgi:hypothetical protein
VDWKQLSAKAYPNVDGNAIETNPRMRIWLKDFGG